MGLKALRLRGTAMVIAMIVATVVSHADEPAHKPIRAGIIGLDTSHVVAFTKIFNEPGATGDVADVRIVAAFPAGSTDIKESSDRIEGFTKQVKAMGVEIVDSIPALLPKVDAVLLESVDGRPHLEQVRPVLEAGKPVFIDKPLAGSLADAIAISELAKKHDVPWFSSSSLRFGPGIAKTKADPKLGEIVGCDTWGPCHLEPHHPDLYWYGIHGCELLYTYMGTGCEQVSRSQTEGTDVVVGVWKDGRIGTFRGIRQGKQDYGAIVFGAKGVVLAPGYEGYKPLAEQIATFFKTRQPPVKAEETLELMTFMEAADESKRQGGKPVKLEEVFKKAQEQAQSKLTQADAKDPASAVAGNPSIGVTDGFDANKRTTPPIAGLTGDVGNIQVAVPAAQEIQALDQVHRSADLDLKRMAQWAMNYLIRTPRAQLGFEPVFQCHPLRCPPVPSGADPVVACDTDARMDWEWYYMREVSGSDAGKDVEAAFHRRIRAYIAPDGRVWSFPGAFNEGATDAKYSAADRVIHIWGATKILKSLSEDFSRTQNPESKALARKVMTALERLATWDKQGRCWFACGMGAFRGDGSVVPNGWNGQPAPIVEPLVTYWQATGDAEGLVFARAYADGMIDNCQPGAIQFKADGTVAGGFGFGPHSHATMHAVWGVADLGLMTGDEKYTRFARGVFDWMLHRGTGTGWFPAGPDNCNETCCISDMISIATLLGRSGEPQYFDDAERYFRNYIANLQFVVTPGFESYYRQLNAAAGEHAVAQGLAELRKFQGGVIGGSGVNDYENVLLGGASGFEMFGCCAPEGMRAIHTMWESTIQRLPRSTLGPEGVYVNFGLNTSSKLGEVISFMPDSGRLTVKAAVNDSYFLRPPHWANHDQVRAFVGSRPIPVSWSGAYVRFGAAVGDELTITYPLMKFTQSVGGLWKDCAPNLRVSFEWLGNMVIRSDPAAARTPLYTGSPRQLPPIAAAR
jgi:predicted dehydrogenase